MTTATKTRKSKPAAKPKAEKPAAKPKAAEALKPTAADGAKAEAAFQRGIFLRLRTGWIAFKRKVDVDKISAGDADKKLLSVHKLMIDCGEHRRIDRVRAVAQHYLGMKAIPTPNLADNTFLIPFDVLDEVIERMDEYVAERRKAVEAFIKVYNDEKEAAKRRLGSKLFDASEYPTDDELRRGFYFEWQLLEESVPNRLKDVNASAFQAELKKFRERLAETAEVVKWGMRAELQDLVAHLVDRLAPDDKGERKVFRKSAIENVTEWLDYFAPKNAISQDDELAAIAERAKKLLSGVDVEGLKKDDKYQKQVQADVTVIKAALDGMLEKRPARLIGGEV